MTTNQQPSPSEMPPAPTLSIYLNFTGQCQEAFEFYRSVFGGEFSNIMTFREAPEDGGGLEIPDEIMDQIMHVSLPIGSGVLMGSDVPPGMGAPLTVGNNYSINYTAPSRAEADRVFAALSHGGQVTMELQDMFWGDYFGSCIDRFGIGWQVDFPPEGGEGA